MHDLVALRRERARVEELAEHGEAERPKVICRMRCRIEVHRSADTWVAGVANRLIANLGSATTTTFDSLIQLRAAEQDGVE